MVYYIIMICSRHIHNAPHKPHNNKNNLIEIINLSAYLGDDSPKSRIRPRAGNYKNKLVRYESNGNLYLYDSNGKYVKLSKELLDDVSISFIESRITEEALAKLQERTGVDIDLSRYMTKSEFESTYRPDLSIYATKEELADIQPAEVDLGGYATKEDLANLNIPEAQDLSIYATKEELAQAQLGGDGSDVDLSIYATKAEVEELKNKPEIDLGEYAKSEHHYTKDEADGIFQVKGNYLTESDIANLATKDELPEIPEMPDISNLATKDELPTGYLVQSDIENKADKSAVFTKEEANERFALKNEVKSEDGEPLDLSDFLKSSDAEAKYAKISDIPEVPDVSSFITADALANLATKDELPKDYLVAADIADKADRTDIPDISNLATKDEIPTDYLTSSDLENYATKGDIPEMPDVSEFITADALANFATKDELPNNYLTAGDIADKADKTDIPDVSEFITSEALNGYAKSEDIPEIPDVSEFITAEALINLATKDELPTDYLTAADIEDKANKSDIPDVSNFATKDQIPDISGKADKSEIPTDYLTAQDIADKADRSELPDISNLVTKDELPEEVDLSEYYNKEEVDEKITKTYDRFVVVGIYGQSNAVGYDESILTHFDKPKYANRLFQIGHNSREFKPLTYCAENAQDMSTVTANGKGGFRSNDAWVDEGRINYAKTKGVALPLANLIADAIPEDYGVIIVPSAFGGKTIDNLSKNGQGYYGRFIENLKTAVNRNEENILLGIVWCQGEYDANNNVTGATYKTKFQNLINDVKNDLEEVKNKTIDKKSVDASKWYVFEYPVHYKNINNNRGREILQAQKEVVGESNYAYIPDETPFNETTITSATLQAHFAGDSYRKVIAPRVFSRMSNNGLFSTNIYEEDSEVSVDTSELESEIIGVKRKNTVLEMIIEELKKSIEDLGGSFDDPTRVTTNLVQGDLLTDCYYVNAPYTATVVDGNLTIQNGGNANGKAAVMLDTTKYTRFEGTIEGDNFAVFMAVKPEDNKTGQGIIVQPTSDGHNAYWVNRQGGGNHGYEGTIPEYNGYTGSLNGKKLVVDIDGKVVTVKVDNQTILSYDLSVRGLLSDQATVPAIGFSTGISGQPVVLTGCKVSYPAPIPDDEENEGELRVLQESDFHDAHKRGSSDNIGTLTVSNGTMSISGGGGVGAHMLPDGVTHFEGTISQDTTNSIIVMLAKNDSREEGLFIPKLNNNYARYKSDSSLLTGGTVNGTYATTYSGSYVGSKLTMDIIDGTKVKVTLGGQIMYEHDLANGPMFSDGTCTTPALGFGAPWTGAGGVKWQFTDCKIS